MSAWLAVAVALAGWALVSYVVGCVVGKVLALNDRMERAVYSDGSPYDQDALNLDVLADALAAPAFTDEKCGAGPRTRRR